MKILGVIVKKLTRVFLTQITIVISFMRYHPGPYLAANLASRGEHRGRQCDISHPK